MPLPELTPMQRVQLGTVYDRIAALLPVEGRDYRISLALQDNRLQVGLNGITPFGTTFANYCMEQLGRKTDGQTRTPVAAIAVT